ncbi:MAG: hypothetical protein RBT25_00220 [Lentisphaeria bacterium]|nr:hypothetical protein [Lentisphaeria bacterium]
MKTRLFCFLTLFILFCRADDDNLLQNPDFSLLTETGTIAAWHLSANAQVSDGVLTLPLSQKRKDSDIHTASVVQSFKNIQAGLHSFSAQYKGEFKNLYIVLRVYDEQGKQRELLQKWLSRKDFIAAAGQPGWFGFFYHFKVPEGINRASIHIEPWGNLGESIEIRQIKLCENED